MNDLEDRIRTTLDQRTAGVPAILAMPAGTRSRIRSRQAGTALLGLATAMAFSFITFQLFSTPTSASRTADGGGGSVVVPAPSGPDVSQAWHDVDPPAPGAWPNVTVGDLVGAYIDTSEGEDVSFLVDKTLIDAGKVQDEAWSLVALQQNGNGAMWSDAAPGPCGEVYLGRLGEAGGGSFCLRLDAMEGSPEMASMGIVWGAGPVTAYAGVVTDRVERVEIKLAGGGSRRVPLPDVPGGVTGRLFVMFVPNGARGSVVAYGASGDVVGRDPLCAAELDVPHDATGACGSGLVSSSSPVASGP